MSALSSPVRLRALFATAAVLLLLCGAMLLPLPAGLGGGPAAEAAPAPIVPIPAQPDTQRISLVVAGDVMGHDPQFQGAWLEDEKRYRYGCFRHLHSYVQAADYAIANLEVTLGGRPYAGYPQFSSPDELAVALQAAGFDLLLTANNHSNDRYNRGLVRTLRVLDSLGIPHLGTYRTPAERDSTYPYLLDVKGFRLALLNATYGTNGLYAKLPASVNMLEKKEVVLPDLQRLDSLLHDLSIFFPHWGNEYELTEHQVQKDWAQWMANHGTDLILGSHPHVVQPIRKYIPAKDSSKTVPVVFSLGNFVSAQRKRGTDGGILLRVTLARVDGGPVYVESLHYLPVWVRWNWKKPTSLSQHDIIPVADWELNPAKYNLSTADSAAIATFAADTRTRLKDWPEDRFYNYSKE